MKMPFSDTTAVASAEAMLTPAEAAEFLKISQSWLAKARMRGDGPPFMRIRRSIRYSRGTLIDWMKSRQRARTR
jgi:hypothetical protein